MDMLLAWEAASPLDDSPCRGYSHLYGLRLQVCWLTACIVEGCSNRSDPLGDRP